MNKLAFHKGYTEGLEKVAISTLDKTSASMPPFRIIDPAKFVAKQVRTGMTYTPPGPGKPAASFSKKTWGQRLAEKLKAK